MFKTMFFEFWGVIRVMQTTFSSHHYLEMLTWSQLNQSLLKNKKINAIHPELTDIIKR
jgi:hypothetical protein